MRGRDFLEIVRRYRHETSEPFLRDRIGRAYYAAYLEARTFCETQLGYTRTKSSREHREVARLIEGKSQRVADRLAFLRSMRNTADYELDISLTTLTADAEDAAAYAEEIIAWLDDLAAALSPSEPE
ncbi:MAG: HEPN domain-containing protein [Thermomicrobiales bacterium]